MPLARLFAASVAPKVKPGLVKLTHLSITPAKNGFEVGHHFNGLTPSKSFVFPNRDSMVKHIAHTAHQVWLGNKTGMPRLRGASKAHREMQLEESSYRKPGL